MAWFIVGLSRRYYRPSARGAGLDVVDVSIQRLWLVSTAKEHLAQNGDNLGGVIVNGYLAGDFRRRPAFAVVDG